MGSNDSRGLLEGKPVVDMHAQRRRRHHQRHDTPTNRSPKYCDNENGLRNNLFQLAPGIDAGLFTRLVDSLQPKEQQGLQNLESSQRKHRPRKGNSINP